MFKARPDIRWEGFHGDGYPIIDVFHWLTERLEHHDGFQRRFDRWVNLGWLEGGDEPYTNSPATVDEYIDRLSAKGWANKHQGEFVGWTNTYNHDNSLSQDLQFRWVDITDHPEFPDTSLLFLSIHNGCDARGGYTDFKIFEGDPWEFFDWDDFTAHCDKCETHPAPADTTLFNEAPYVTKDYGHWWHRHGSWDNDNGRPDPLTSDYKLPDDAPDDLDFTDGPICPIHYTTMEVYR